MDLKITERTFGIELEYADLDKKSVYFPAPFTWDEEEVIHNTDSTRGTVKARYGGEINTPPMRLTHADTDVFKRIVESCKANGAIARRDCGVQVHIFIGDLTVEELKRIYYLSYHTTDILKDLCHLPPYSDEQKYRPSPTSEFYQRIKVANSFNEVQRIFENSHNKGYVRHFVNVASYFVRQTVEFRLFNSTTDTREIANCILFAYRFVDYALAHTEDDFKAIKTVEDFVIKVKVSTALPELPPPLIFFSSIREMDKGKTTHKAVDISKPFMSELIKSTGDTVICVNPQSYSTEIRLSETKTVKVYCNDELNDLMYQIAKDGLRIHYANTLKELEALNGDDAVKQIAALMVFRKIFKWFKDNATYEKRLASIKAVISRTYDNALPSAQRIVGFLSACEYHRGTLNDALNETGDVFFQYDDYASNRTVVDGLRRHSDYKGVFDRKRTHYLGVVENIKTDTDLFLISDYPYHNMEKVYKMGKRCLYSTRKVATAITYKQSHKAIVEVALPPDTLAICDASKLQIVHVPGYQFKQIQEQFVKKIEHFSVPSFPFFVFYDSYLIGAFGFSFTRVKEYDIVLMSDFSTNNHIPRLAKLILLCVKSKFTKRWLSRKLQGNVETCFTKAFTHKPVSMKYRGPFKKVSQERNCLIYETTLGQAGSYEDIITEYQNQISRMK